MNSCSCDSHLKTNALRCSFSSKKKDGGQKQRLQLRADVFLEEDPYEKAASLMIQIASKYHAGEIPLENLYIERARLLKEHGVARASTKCSEVKKRPAAATSTEELDGDPLSPDDCHDEGVFSPESTARGDTCEDVVPASSSKGTHVQPTLDCDFPRMLFDTEEL